MAKNRRKKILKAAENLLGNRRFHEVTVDAIAQAAGVGKGTIYRYFEDKESLFAELANFGFDELYASMRSTQIESGAFAENLQRVCETITRFFSKRCSLMRVMNEAEDREAGVRKRFKQEGHDHRRRLHDELVRWLEEGVALGEVREDVPLEQQALFLLSMLRGRNRAERRMGVSVPLENLIAVFLDGSRERGDR